MTGKQKLMNQDEFLMWCYMEGEADYRDAFTYFNETKLLILCSIFLHGTNLLFNCLIKN